MKHLFMKLLVGFMMTYPTMSLIACNTIHDKIEILNQRFKEETNKMVLFTKSLVISNKKEWKIEKILQKVFQEKINFTDYFEKDQLIKDILKNQEKYKDITKRYKESINPLIRTGLVNLEEELNKDDFNFEKLLSLLSLIEDVKLDLSIIKKHFDKNNLKGKIEELIKNYNDTIKTFESNDTLNTILLNINFSGEDKKILVNTFKKIKNEEALSSKEITDLIMKIIPVLVPMAVLIVNYELKLQKNPGIDFTKTIKELQETPYSTLINNIKNDLKNILKTIKFALTKIMNLESDTFKAFIKIINLDNTPFKKIIEIINNEETDKIDIEDFIKKGIKDNKVDILTNLEIYLPDEVLKEDDTIIADIVELLKVIPEKLDLFLKKLYSNEISNFMSILTILDIAKKKDQKISIGSLGEKLSKIISSKLFKHILQQLMNIFLKTDEGVVEDLIKDEDKYTTFQKKWKEENDNEYSFLIKIGTRADSQNECWTFNWKLNTDKKTMKIVDYNYLINKRCS